jgi:hypothetical protein
MSVDSSEHDALGQQMDFMRASHPMAATTSLPLIDNYIYM